MSDEIKNHKRMVNDHKALKESILSQKDVLCIEFDFGQNLLLSKILVNEQFYKRLIWLNVFNVHVFENYARSYMYFFVEGKIKKGSNTVCNLIWDAIKKEFTINYYNKIFLFSDNCGGQNKSYLLLSFLSLRSAK